MNLTAVIVGVGKWDEYTKPCLDSIKATNPDWHVVCVDNGSQYPDYEGVQMERVPNIVSYAEGLNFGLIKAPVSNWYLILNNDIIIEKTISTKDLDHRALYGFIKYTFARDSAMWLEMARQDCNFYYIPEALGMYNFRDNSLEHRNIDIMIKENARIRCEMV